MSAANATVENKASDAAVNDVANTLATLNIEKAEEKNADAVLASAAEGRRLYIGNLAYATKEGELKDFFKNFLVESVSIPKNPRTDKPVGYAFVDVSTPSEAETAIRDLSGQEILGRKVSVQLARKPEPNAEKQDNGEGSGGEGARRRASGRGRGRGRGRGGRGGRGGRAEGAAHEEGAGEQAAGTAESGAATTTEVQPLADITNQNADEGKKGQNRAQRERRERGPPADGIPSKTKVMVANLPYELTEDKLRDLFSAYKPSSAKIALRPIPRFMIKKLQARGEQRKGRGFGFVTLESEEMQQLAVKEMNGKEIDGREIAVKVAIDSPDKTDDHEHADHGEEAAAGANGTPETAPAAEGTATTAAPATATATATA